MDLKLSPTVILIFVAGYFLLLLLISWFTSRKSTNYSFFIGDRASPWYLVAFGMIGASLSGVTFISVPGWVASTQFSYMQMVYGYLAGYLVIATVLLPLYYHLNLTSIYTYLEKRFGVASYKTGAAYFLLSRTIGASFRLYLVASVLQYLVFDHMGIPFAMTVLLTILLIWIYTFKGGIKTIVWTDSLQTLFMLLSVGISIIFIAQSLELNFSQLVHTISESEYSSIFFWDIKQPNHFIKQFLSGMFIAIVMTGLDQDMMQKNLSCRNLGEAQKNMFWFSIILVFVNLIFLSLGALLYIYAGAKGLQIPEKADQLFPMIAVEHLPPYAGVIFLIGLIAAAYSSADSALTALTTSFCVDFLNFEKESGRGLANQKTRLLVHIGFSVLLFLVICLFGLINKESVISDVFKAAGYTYGPLLGLYTFGLFTKRAVWDKWVPAVCILSPVISYLLNEYIGLLIPGFEFGFSILIVNGALTFLGLYLLSIARPKNMLLTNV